MFCVYSTCSTLSQTIEFSLKYRIVRLATLTISISGYNYFLGKSHKLRNAFWAKANPKTA